MAKVKLTAGRIAAFQCDKGKAQSFLWCDAVPGLGLRATFGGSKSYIFQSKVMGQSMRVTLGDAAVWSIVEAQAEARRLQIQIDNGNDPRQVKSDKQAAEQVAHLAKEVAAAEQRAQIAIEQAKRELIARVAWNAYVDAPHPKWGAVHRKDHITAALEGGDSRKIGKEKTKPAPLASLLNRPLHEITASVVEQWLEAECITRPTFAHNAFRKFRTFIRWCAKHPEFRHVVHADCCLTDEVKDIVPSGKTKEGDCLQREQLPDWFVAVRQIGNPVISAYLIGLLLTGARRGEMAGIKWQDVDFQWNSLTIRDKVEGLRIIPLTPYLAHLLAALPRRSDWVFSSPISSTGHITEPRIAHTKALQIVGLPHVSLHGLRRSFSTLAEWCEVPTGVVAQIMGHKPSAIAEKHYRRRPLDLLRKWHSSIEAWILEQAGIEFVPTKTGLRVVA